MHTVEVTHCYGSVMNPYYNEVALPFIFVVCVPVIITFTTERKALCSRCVADNTKEVSLITEGC